PAHAPELLGLAAGADRGRLGAHRPAAGRERGALRGAARAPTPALSCRWGRGSERLAEVGSSLLRPRGRVGVGAWRRGASGGPPPRPSPAGGEGAAGDWRKSAAPFPARGGGLGWAPAAAVPSAAARFTSAIVTTPSAPVPVTRLRSTRSLRASARTAGIALTP